MDFYTVEPCTTSDAFEIKFVHQVKIDLKKAAVVLNRVGTVLADTPAVLVMKANDFNASIYASGRIMVKNATKEQVTALAMTLVKALEDGGAFV